MFELEKVKKRLKTPKVIFLIVGALALALVVFFARDQLNEAWQLLGRIRWPYLLAIPAIQLINYYAVAKHHEALLSSFKLKPPFRKLFELAFAMTFVNTAAPSVGVSGVSFFTYSLSQDDIPAGKSTLSYVSRYILMYLSFGLILVVGALVLFFSDDIARITVRIAVLLALGIVALNAWLIYEISVHKRLDKVAYWLTSIVDKIGAWLHKDNRPLIGHDRIKKALAEFHSGFEFIRQKRQEIVKPFLWMLVASVAEVVTLYAVLVAFGFWLNPGIVIFAYAIGNLAGFLAAVVPAGAGAYDAAMVTAFAATGVSVALAISATLLYRVVNMGIILPTGFYFYQKHLRSAEDARTSSGS